MPVDGSAGFADVAGVAGVAGVADGGELGCVARAVAEPIAKAMPVVTISVEVLMKGPFHWAGESGKTPDQGPRRANLRDSR